MKKRKDVLLLVALIIILLTINYSFLDKTIEKFLTDEDSVFVERVIDGDTFVIENTSVRLLGINTPERGEFYYQEAKDFLEELVLNKTVRLEYWKDRTDKYGRTLAYIFLNRENVNLKLVEEGFANYYFYGGRDKHSDALENAWESCIENNVNLCEKSINSCASCMEIKDSKTLINSCGFGCDINNWEIKTEGRNKFIFSEKILEQGEEILFVLELMDTGDTLFLRDVEGKLVVWGGV
ncbi:MAG TPA: hypothetical protein ENH99_01755 [Candidatus Pacearchaeota archaeon]|nr:hypothetical protein [Candidatus Pacearchaeota archaeon]